MASFFRFLEAYSSSRPSTSVTVLATGTVSVEVEALPCPWPEHPDFPVEVEALAEQQDFPELFLLEQQDFFPEFPLQDFLLFISSFPVTSIAEAGMTSLAAVASTASALSTVTLDDCA